MANSPYTHDVEHITNVDKFFRYDADNHCMIFVGESLELRVPKRFEVYGLLEVTETVTCVGVMDLIIDEKYQAGLNLLAKIEVAPREISEMVYDENAYLVMYLEHGDRFITHTQVVRDGSIVPSLYVEFITRGKTIYTLDYVKLALLFDRAKAMTGSGIGVDRVLFEMIVSHLARSQDDVFKQYRHTDMAKSMRLIRLRSVSYAPTSTTARLLGSYFDDGLTASLIHQVAHEQPFENLLRGLPYEAPPGNDAAV